MERPVFGVERGWLKFYPENVEHDVEVPGIPLFKLFEDAAEKNRDKVAVIFFDTKITYGTLLDHCRRVANALNKLGIRKRDKVAILLPNSPQFIVAYYGSLMAGATVTPMNPLYTAREIEYQARDSGAKVIFTLDIFYKSVAETLPNTKIEHVIVSNIADYLPPAKKFLGKLLGKIPSAKVKGKVIWLMELIQGAEPVKPDVKIDPDKDIMSLQYTGGTTGIPKGVKLVHRNVVANIVQVLEFLKNVLVPGEEVMVGLLPFYHIYGQTVLIGIALTQGNTILVFPKLDFIPFLKTISKYRATIFPGVPTLFNMMAKYERIGEIDLSSVKLVISGADRLPVEVAEAFEKAVGMKICEGYGLTETSPVTHINPPERIKKGSFGVPIPGTFAAILDLAEPKFLPPGKVGELVVSGPQVMEGYWGKDEETAAAFVEIGGMKWFRTGDLCKMDEEGYFYFVERYKDLIKYKGFSVFPAEVESTLYEHKAVKEVAVVGMPDPAVGERVVAAVALKDQYKGKVSENELIEWCRERIAEYKVPQRIIFVDEVPKTVVGKVFRRKVRELLVEKA